MLRIHVCSIDVGKGLIGMNVFRSKEIRCIKPITVKIKPVRVTDVLERQMRVV